jgi:hypothetical protein
MNTLKVVLISFALIIINNVLGHYFSPISILLTPVVIGIISVLISRLNIPIILVVLLVIASILFNDILVKLFAGGTSDFEGAGFINLFLIIACIIATVITLALLITTHKHNIIYTILACLLIPLSVYIHLLYFDFLGLVDDQNASATKAISIQNKVFIGDLAFSDHQIICRDDTLKIIDGWCEKQVIVDHTHLLKKCDRESSVNYIIHVKSNKKFDGLKISYKVNDDDINGSFDIDSVLKFSDRKLAPQPFITFFKLSDTIKNSTIIKQISITPPFKNY